MYIIFALRCRLPGSQQEAAMLHTHSWWFSDLLSHPRGVACFVAHAHILNLLCVVFCTYYTQYMYPDQSVYHDNAVISCPLTAATLP